MRMKQEYEFRLPPKPISSDDIARHKDFDALLQAHGSGARRRDVVQMRRLMYAGAGLVAAAVALLLIFRLPHTISDASKALADWDKQILVPPPLPALQPEYQPHTIAAAEETAIAGNPRILVAPGSFIDDQGMAVEGEVELYIRKLDDFVDFFLAGIKLNYEAPNGKRQLESAGMVEIYAEQNGKRVFLAPGKTVNVEFESIAQLTASRQLPIFNEYYLDTEAGAWVAQRRSRTELLGNAEPDAGDPMYREKMALYQQLTDLDSSLELERARWESANPAPIAPQKPQRSSPDQPTLELDFLEGAVPETASGEEARLYKGTIWQVSPRSPAIDQRAFGVTWQSARLRQLEADDYELILSHGATTLRLIVNPVLTGSAYEQALNAYRTALAGYERALQQWNESAGNHLAAARRQVEKDKATALKSWEKQWSENTPLRAKLRHYMSIDRLGLWTVAQPLPYPSTVTAGRITDQHENTYEQRVAYVVNPQQNTLHQVIIAGNSRIPLAPGSTLWVVNQEGKIAVLRPKELQQVLSNVTSPKLVLELQEQLPGSKAELKRILQL